MDSPADPLVFAGTVAQLRAAGQLTVRGRHRPLLVLPDGDGARALDNRCPHMGFPLDQGSVNDGILTCHWHHARFDVASGCTFDLWADDIPAYRVELRGDEIWVDPRPGDGDTRAHHEQRLADGMSHGIGLVIAKSVHGLLASGAQPEAVVRQAALCGARNRDGWSSGLTILTALGNLVPALENRDVYVALFHGTRRVARDCEGEAPRIARYPLESTPGLVTLKRWFRRWCEVRHREGAERTLLTAISAGTSPADLADMLFAAETDRVYSGGGHTLDFTNKAFECLDMIGWAHAEAILPTVVGDIVSARSAAESTAWRQPEDLIELVESACGYVAHLASGDRGQWTRHEALGLELLADSPQEVISALTIALHEGASPVDCARALVYAAALRLVQFSESNEQSDWETAHHTFTYCNAVHHALKRIGENAPGDRLPDAVRGVFHGAMAVYLNRYMNVPPAPIPEGDGARAQSLPSDSAALLRALLETFDRPRQVDAAAGLASRYLALGFPPEALIATLGRALLREDAGFHAYQSLEAGVCQFREWGNTRPGRHILIGVTRYLAAHSPTTRAISQTARIAEKLMRGDSLDAEASHGANAS